MADVGDLGDVTLRLTVAVAIGGAIGLDREWHGKSVGVRTLALVSLGAALVCLSSLHFGPIHGDVAAISRVLQGVIQGVMAGIGFLGAGAVLHRRGQPEGLTTAATVWVTAALGIACALATWPEMLTGVALTLIVLVLLHPIDWVLERRRNARR